MFTDFVYLVLFLLSLYGFGIPLFQNSRMVGPGAMSRPGPQDEAGYCLWLLRLVCRACSATWR